MLELHPLCTFFPRMSDEEFTSLKDDILQNGQNEDVVVYNGMILDGGHRYRACIELGIDPKLRAFDGENIVSFVMSANLRRRHLSPGQSATIVALLDGWKDNDSQKQSKNGRSETTIIDRADAAGVGRSTQAKADRLVRSGTKEEVELVISGEKSLDDALVDAGVVQPKPEHHEEAHDLAAELRHADDEIRALQGMVSSLQATDKDKELVEATKKFRQMQGRLEQEMATCKEAKEQARYSSGLLAKIRKELGVSRDAEIVPAIQDLKR